MNIIGIRAKPNTIVIAVYNPNNSSIENIETIKIPNALSNPEALKYVRNSILDILREYEICYAGIRITEANSQNLNINRLEIEGVIQEAFASSMLLSYHCCRISNIAANLNMKREEIKPIIDGTTTFDLVENWQDLNKEEKEAALVAIGVSNVNIQ